jgi:hypothetical protein
MVEDEIIDELTVLFEKAGRAHHEAFVDAAGEDPEWPLWYSDYLVERLNEVLGSQMTRSELCYLLVGADRERCSVAPGCDWHAYFARFFADRYGS